MEMKAEDLETLSRLGEGAAGTVRKVLHKPTGLIMAKKVRNKKTKRFYYYYIKTQSPFCLVHFNRS
jgi:hypothetical protein